MSPAAKGDQAMTSTRLRGLLSGVALAVAVAAGAFSPVGASAKLLTKPDGVVRHDIEVTTVDPTAVQAPNRWTGKPNRNFVLAPQNPADRKKKLFLYIVGSGISETTAQEGNRERFGFSKVSIEIKEFKAGGFSKLEFAHPNLIPNRLGFLSEKAVVVDDVVMSMGSSSPTTDDNTKKNFEIQELVRQPLAEISPNHHEQRANQNSSMEIEIRNLSKVALKRIDPMFLPKKVGREEEVNPPNDQDDEALGNLTNG